MWNPLNDPTPIEELQTIHKELRKKYPQPCVELYNEYWTRLQTITLDIQHSEFRNAVRSWRRVSRYNSTMEQNIRDELKMIHELYVKTITSIDLYECLTKVETFLRFHKPTYIRKIPTALGYPKYKDAYGCCSLNSGIPATGFRTCICQTHRKLCIELEQFQIIVTDEESLHNIQEAQEKLLVWLQEEQRARRQYYGGVYLPERM